MIIDYVCFYRWAENKENQNKEYRELNNDSDNICELFNDEFKMEKVQTQKIES